MIRFLVFITAAIILTGCSHTYYVVRHAEKAAAGSGTMMANDPPLTEAGMQRADALRDSLEHKGIRYIYSTNTQRTRFTAEPLRARLGLQTTLYNPAQPDSAFIATLQSLRKSALIVGHSNTVDDIVNKLCGAQKVAGDLADNEYDNLFVVRYRHFFGTKIHFERRKYGR